MLDQLLDVAQERHFLVVAERDRDALRAGARGAADAVHVALRNVRQVVVDDVADAVDVDAARRDVGRDQRLELAGAERAEHALALVLRLVAVDRLGRNAGMMQALHHLVGAVLGAREHQRLAGHLAAQHLDQQRGLGRLVDHDDALRRRARRVDATGVTATRAGSRSICAARSAISRGMVAENSSVWRSFGSFATMVRMSWMKPMSSMRSASSSTSTSTWLRRTPFDLHQVEQAAGRRDQHVETVHQVAHLPSHRHAADHERGLDAHVAAVGAEAFEDLARELARRAEHQHARALLLQRLTVGGEPVEDRKRERGGLAGAGLRDADEVASGEDDRNGVGLDRGGGGVLLLSKGTGDRLCEAEFVEGVQNITVLLRRGARRNGVACRGVVVDTPPGLGCQCDWRYRRAGRNRCV